MNKSLAAGIMRAGEEALKGEDDLNVLRDRILTTELVENVEVFVALVAIKALKQARMTFQGHIRIRMDLALEHKDLDEIEFWAPSNGTRVGKFHRWRWNSYHGTFRACGERNDPHPPLITALDEPPPDHRLLLCQHCAGRARR